MPIKINGATSGSTTITAPNTGSDETIELSTALAAKLGTLSVNAQTGTAYTLTTSDPQKVVTMTNAAASTVTIPTNATAAIPVGSAVQIVNLSTGVNTTVSPAGGVTLNGGTVVLSPGSSATLVKIATDAWMVQGQGAPGMTLVASSSFTAVSSVSINNCFSVAYLNYRLVLEAVGSGSTPADVQYRMRSAGSDATGANYANTNLFQTNVGGPTRVFSEGQTLGQLGMATNITSGIVADVFRPFAAQDTMVTGLAQAWGTGSSQFWTIWSTHTVDTSYDGITLFTSSGTFTGTVRIYGYRNS